jgi:hypothetical protein
VERIGDAKPAEAFAVGEPVDSCSWTEVVESDKVLVPERLGPVGNSGLEAVAEGQLVAAVPLPALVTRHRLVIQLIALQLIRAQAHGDGSRRPNVERGRRRGFLWPPKQRSPQGLQAIRGVGPRAAWAIGSRFGVPQQCSQACSYRSPVDHDPIGGIVHPGDVHDHAAAVGPIADHRDTTSRPDIGSVP